MENTIYHEKLGRLQYSMGPQSIHDWHGSLSGCEQGFDIILSSPDLDKADIDFIAAVIKDWQRYEEKALAYMRGQLTRQPELFKLSKEEGEYTARMQEIPFGYPQFVFYEKQEWMVISLENALGIGGQFGMSVSFEGENPIDIFDLSESEEIEEE